MDRCVGCLRERAMRGELDDEVEVKVGGKGMWARVRGWFR